MQRKLNSICDGLLFLCQATVGPMSEMMTTTTTRNKGDKMMLNNDLLLFQKVFCSFYIFSRFLFIFLLFTTRSSFFVHISHHGAHSVWRKKKNKKIIIIAMNKFSMSKKICENAYFLKSCTLHIVACIRVLNPCTPCSMVICNTIHSTAKYSTKIMID